MTTYIIYQRTNVDSDRINSMPTSNYAKAFFALGMPTHDNVEMVVSDGLHHDMYEPTMIMHDFYGKDKRTPFEAIFDEGNGYGDGTLTTTEIRKHPSMSVGDILYDLTNGWSHVCMPVGWHSLNLTLQLNEA